MHVCVVLCLSGSAWCHSQITFLSLGAHVFIAIRHDVISPGPEQSYLSGRSQPVRGAPNPVLLTPMHDLFCNCFSLITALQLWLRHSKPSNHNSGWRHRCVWVWCCCCCLCYQDPLTLCTTDTLFLSVVLFCTCCSFLFLPLVLH